MRKFFDNIGKLIWDFVTDKNNDGDEKRALGTISIILGFIYSFRPDANVLILTELFTFGGGLLSVAAIADKIPKRSDKSIDE